MRLTHRVLVCALATCPVIGWAGKCDRVLATDQLISCLGEEYSLADGRLNATYNALRGRLEVDRRNQLKDAQVAWLAFRDKDCEFEAGAAQGGQAYQPLFISCQTRKTIGRVQELRELAK